jgi:hypothetical protein
MPTGPRQDIEPYLDYYGYQLKDIELQRESQAPIWMHETDRYMVENSWQLFDRFHVPVYQLIGREGDMGEARERFVTRIPHQDVERGLHEGDLVDLGGGIRTLAAYYRDLDTAAIYEAPAPL